MPQVIKNSFLSRIRKVRENLSDYQVDGILFSSASNIRYLTGFTGSDGVLIISPDSIQLLVDGRYTTQAAREVQPIPVVRYFNKIQGIEQAVRQLGLTKIGFEASFVNVETYNDLKRRLKKGILIPLSKELRLLRTHKDKYEADLLKKAAAIASQSVAALAGEIQPGWTERETALRLEIMALQAGAEQIAFETIIASGENAALPHARPTHRKIRKGDFVVVDFGVKYQGYCSDETCTFAIGKLTGEQKNAYRAVLRTHDKIIASIKAGAVAADLDALARRTLGKEYGPYFIHGTGHGVGLDVHEAPRLSPDSKDTLTAGMVVTVEPGLYYPSRWGIRIEDTVFVKKNSCEIITKMDKKLITIE